MTRASYLLWFSVMVMACDGTTPALACIDCDRDRAPEYIIVGSGAGGGPLAARLARAGHRVLLLEAGKDVGGSLQYQVPAMHALSTENAESAWWFWVKHSSDPAVDQTDTKVTPQGILYPRGSALGGSTAVNAMVTVLPPPSDWDSLAHHTLDNSFRAVHMQQWEDKVREWLEPEFADPKLALDDAQVSSFLTAAAQTFSGETAGTTPGTAASLESLVRTDVNAELRSGEATGLFRLPLATRQGRRIGTRERLLSTVEAGYPLTIVTNAFVTRVLWSKQAGLARPRAIGVEYVQQAHVYEASLAPQSPPSKVEQALATREVILSAGAFNTPQLLMLSGLGEASTLRKLGIDVVAERPGVGRGLQDRYEAPVVYELDTPVKLLRACELGSDAPHDACLDEWQAGRGVYETPGFLATVLKRSSPDVTAADLQIFAAPTDIRGYYPGYAKAAATSKRFFSWLMLKAHTNNDDGTVTLRDSSPFSRPEIHFHSYAESDPLHDPDLLALVSGLRFVRSMRAKQTGVQATEIWPGLGLQSDEQLAKWIRKESWGHHACCTSRIGQPDDALAVVDSRYRVIGVDALRVVDASVFPRIPGTFIAMPIFMASERAAGVILSELP